MFVDELYFGVFVAFVMMLSKISGAFDKYVVDGLVNLLGQVVRLGSVVAGLHDRYIVDGAVNGVGSLVQELGAAVRVPQTGRIRGYVTTLIAVVGLGLAGAIVVMLSR